MQFISLLLKLESILLMKIHYYYSDITTSHK